MPEIALYLTEQSFSCDCRTSRHESDQHARQHTNTGKAVVSGGGVGGDGGVGGGVDGGVVRVVLGC